MKLTILGTGCAWTKRACASYLLDKDIIVDPGFGSIKQLLKSDDRLMNHEKIERIDLVLITHFHSDHFFDMPYILQKNAIGKYADRKLMVITPPGGKEIITALCNLGLDEDSFNKIDFNKYVDWQEAAPNKTFVWRDLTITSLPMQHGPTVCYGYIIKQPSGKTIAFTGDSNMCESYKYMVDNCNTVVACMANNKREKKLYNIVDGIELMKQYKGKCCIIPAHMTSGGWDYARAHINVPHDLDVLDLEQPLPYDFELKMKTHAHSIKNFKFNSELKTLYSPSLKMQLLEMLDAKNSPSKLPMYKYNIINRATGEEIGRIEITIGYNQYVSHNGSISFSIDDDSTNLTSDALNLIKIVGISHGLKDLYLSTSPENLTVRHFFERLDAYLSEIKTIDSASKKYIDNNDTERCIYVWDILSNE